MGNELVKALQLYLELYEKIGSKEPEIQIIKERAGDIELMTLKEISYDLLNTIIASRGYLEQIEEKLGDIDSDIKEKIDKLRQSLFKAQKIIQDRIEAIK